jgi:hypothetical protein
MYETGERGIAVHAGVGLGHGWLLGGATRLIIALIRRGNEALQMSSSFFPWSLIRGLRCM